MALLGRGLLAIWHDVELSRNEDLTDFHNWYTREHLPERLSIPGFLRGRRYEAITGKPYYAALYETASVETLASESYHERLNNPTPWSTRNLTRFRNTNRTAFTIEYSAGFGVGSGLAVIWLSPKTETEKALKSWLIKTTLPKLLQQSGIVGAHLCIADGLATKAESVEARLREEPDQIAEWIVMVEGHDQTDLDQALSQQLSSAECAKQGAASASTTRHRLIHSAISDEHPNFSIQKRE